MVWIMIIWLCVSCQQSPEEAYKQLEKQELSKNQRYDSLFFGIHFQMTRKNFREYCFDKHLEGRFKQGGMKSGIWVESKLPTGMKFPAAINFYPEFENDKITKMNAAIYYDNSYQNDRSLAKDSLLLDVLNLLDNWYGGNHVKIKSPFFYKEDVYVKINGNRRITIYPDLVGQMINLWYVDLKVKNEQN